MRDGDFVGEFLGSEMDVLQGETQTRSAVGNICIIRNEYLSLVVLTADFGANDFFADLFVAALEVCLYSGQGYLLIGCLNHK